MQLLLVHGMGRTAFSLHRLARHLRRAGHDPRLLGYVAALEPFARIVGRIQHGLQELAKSQRPYAVVGHSLGGLLVRAALARAEIFPQPVHLIMLGTPNRSPRLARRYQRVGLYRWINGESGQILAQASFFEQLPPPPVPYTIIAGTRGWRRRTGPFANDPNDGIVAVRETLVSSTDTPVLLPVSHTFMMNDRQVREAICRILAGAEP
jgi:pimeloyl-ACP methyl ester carboxylesterase